MDHQAPLTNKLLLIFLGISNEHKDVLSNPIVKSQLLGQELEIKALKDQVERLEKAIGDAYSTNSVILKKESSISDNDCEFLIIHKLISEFGEFLKINDEGGLINIVNFPPTEFVSSKEMINYNNFLKNNMIK